jgi:hypothetical protein
MSTQRILRFVVLSASVLGAAGIAGASACLAQDANMETGAIGVTAGDTLGFSWKFIDPGARRNSYESSIGWTVRGEDAWEFRWMYQRVVFDVKRNGGGRVDLYAAGGLRVKLEDDTRYGLRAALGINFIPSDREFSPEIFLEAAPTRDVSPDHRSHVGLAAGVRWRL